MLQAGGGGGGCGQVGWTSAAQGFQLFVQHVLMHTPAEKSPAQVHTPIVFIMQSFWVVKPLHFGAGGGGACGHMNCTTGAHEPGPPAGRTLQQAGRHAALGPLPIHAQLPPVLLAHAAAERPGHTSGRQLLFPSHMQYEAGAGNNPLLCWHCCAEANVLQAGAQVPFAGCGGVTQAQPAGPQEGWSA